MDRKNKKGNEDKPKKGNGSRNGDGKGNGEGKGLRHQNSIFCLTDKGTRSLVATYEYLLGSPATMMMSP